jgi:hypothetical protein
MAHTGAMSRRDSAKPFAEMVQDLVYTPAPPDPDTGVDLSAEQFQGPDGVV